MACRKLKNYNPCGVQTTLPHNYRFMTITQDYCPSSAAEKTQKFEKNYKIKISDSHPIYNRVSSPSTQTCLVQ